MLEAALEGRAIGEFIATAHCGGGGGGRAVDIAFVDEDGGRWRVRPEKVDDGGFSREDPPQLPPLRLWILLSSTSTSLPLSLSNPLILLYYVQLMILILSDSS